MNELVKALNSNGFEQQSALAAMSMVKSGKPIFAYSSHWVESYDGETDTTVLERVWEPTSLPDHYSMVSQQDVLSYVSQWEESTSELDEETQLWVRKVVQEGRAPNPPTWAFWPHVETILGEGNWFVNTNGSIGFYDRKVVTKNLQILEEVQKMGIPKEGKSVKFLTASGYSPAVAIQFSEV